MAAGEAPRPRPGRAARRWEREAKARGLVADAASPVGVFQTSTDRVAPAGR
ncbi:hypothetical protein AB5I41_02020 [Sphingomonas sp. MMS24-JH45]